MAIRFWFVEISVLISLFFIIDISMGLEGYARFNQRKLSVVYKSYMHSTNFTYIVAIRQAVTNEED